MLAAVVNALGMMQSVARYLLLPLAAIGFWFAVRKDWPLTSLFFATIFYYLVPGTFAHAEIRYVLTLHWLLPIFAGLAAVTLITFIPHRGSRRTRAVGDPV